MEEQYKPTILALDDYEPNVSPIKRILEDVDGVILLKPVHLPKKQKEL